MSFADTANALRSRFKTQIEDGEGVTVQYPNAPQVTPEEGSLWVSLHISEGESYTAELGTPNYRNHGILSAQIFAPEHTGTGAALALADTIAAAFRNITFSDVRMKVPRVVRVGMTQNSAWYQISVLCPFFSTT